MYNRPNVNTDFTTIIRRWLYDNFKYEFEFDRPFFFCADGIFTAKIKFERCIEPKKFATENLDLLTLYVDKCVLTSWLYTGRYLQVGTEYTLAVADPTFFDDLKKILNEIIDKLISYGYCLPLRQNGY